MRLYYGTDYDALMAVLGSPVAAATFCDEVVVRYNDIGPRWEQSTLNYPSAACTGAIAGVGAAGALAYLLSRPEFAALLPELLAATTHALGGDATEVAVPDAGNGAGGGTTSGAKLADATIGGIARGLRSLNKGVGELDAATAKAVAQACVATAAFGVPLGPGFCRRPTMPIFVVGANVNEAAQHDFDAIFGNASKGMLPHPAWALLNYSDPALKKQAGQTRAWYRGDPDCAGSGTAFGKDCDEYPFFSTEQGGELGNPKPSLRPIDLGANRREGALLTHRLIRRCGLDSAAGITSTSNGTGGSAYLVLPMPVAGGSNVASNFWKPILSHAPLTFGICNRGGSGRVSTS